MFDGDDVITLTVQWCHGDSDITTDPCAESNADSVRLWTPGGECIAEWERADGSIGHAWNVTASDYALPDSDREALSGYSGPSDAVQAGVKWFRANCGVRSTMRIELD